MIEALLIPPASAQQPLNPGGSFMTEAHGTMSSTMSTVRDAVYLTAGVGCMVNRVAVATGVMTCFTPTPDWRAEATAAVDELSAHGRLAAERIKDARRVLGLLQLWDVLPPTEVGDTSDDDLSLVWRCGGLVASLVVNEDKVLAYVFRPGMREPWVFTQPRIGLADLNAFARKVGSARAEELGRP